MHRAHLLWACFGLASASETLGRRVRHSGVRRLFDGASAAQWRLFPFADATAETPSTPTASIFSHMQALAIYLAAVNPAGAFSFPAAVKVAFAGNGVAASSPSHFGSRGISMTTDARPSAYGSVEDVGEKDFKTTTFDSIIIDAPQSMLWDAYNDIERMPEWLPLLKSVTITDEETKRSEWHLGVPRILRPLAKGVGFGSALQWEATHDGEPYRRIWWKSLTGIKKEGDVIFDPVDGEPGKTLLTASLAWTLPRFMKPVVANPATQRILRRTLRKTITRFRDQMELEAQREVQSV